MGKGARAICIFTPWALTLASFILLALIEAAGWHTNTLPTYHFFQANFTSLSIPNADSNLAASLQTARQTVGLGDIYNINLWNYCSSNKTTTTLDYCSPRESNFYFDPIDVWGLNSTTANTPTPSSNNAIESAVNNLKANSQDLENKLLGESGRKALDTYRTVSKWMFVAYQVSFWTTLATLLISILAIFSRWGSLLTWILSIASSFFTFAAVLTSTILFSVLVGALKGLLDKYSIEVKIGTQALVVGWLAVLFSVSATLFWLFSVCCCSGKSNPHHKSNKGGLWNAEQKGLGYERGTEKGGNFERDVSPVWGERRADGRDEDRVPLYPYPSTPARDGVRREESPYGLDAGRGGQNTGYEGYRHHGY